MESAHFESEEDWREYSPPDKIFKIRMPATPSFFQTDGGNTNVLRLFLRGTRMRRFDARYSFIPGIDSNTTTKESLLRQLAENTRKNSKEVSSVETSNDGIIIRTSKETSISTIKIFIHGEYVFFLSVTQDRGAYAYDQQEEEKFFASFKFYGRGNGINE